MLWDPDGWVQMWICPELRLLQTDEQRLRAVKRAKVAIMSHRWFPLYLAVFVLASLIGAKLLFGLFAAGLITMVVVYPLIVGVAYVLVFAWVYGAHLKRIIRAELRKDGILLCLHCGYDIRGQAKPRCPECGRPFEQSADLGE